MKIIDLKNKIKTLNPNKEISSKYTFYSFLPLTIYYQLRKPSILFFTVILILLCNPKISPFEPYSYLLAYIIVVGTSIIKEGIEDYKKHQEDKINNHRLIKVIEPSENYEENELINFNKHKIINKKIMELREGDFVLLNKDEIIPSDIVLLKTVKFNKNLGDHCFIDTSNIDGETNLKKKVALKGIIKSDINNNSVNKNIKSIESIFDNINQIKIKENNKKNKFFLNSKLLNLIKIKNNNILKKGSFNKSHYLIIGLIINNKKLKNHNNNKIKSRFEKKIDFILKIILFIYFLLIILSTGNFFTNAIIFSYMIPLSLYVMIEMTRIIQMNRTKSLKKLKSEYDENIKTENDFHCRNPNVIEDLGNVDILLSDKTGTLTKNKMKFKRIYTKKQIKLKKFFFNLINKNKILLILAFLLNNSVEVLNNNYIGNSQEELSILSKLKKIKIQILDKNENLLKIKIKDNFLFIEKLKELKFTSLRQKQSVIIKIKKIENRNKNDQIFLILNKLKNKLILFSKGSDTKLLNKKEDKIKESLKKIKDYRILVYKYLFLKKNHSKNLEEIENSDSEDSQRNTLDKFFFDLDQNSKYLASIFIEDQLQEKVKETIKCLNKNNIKIWMITGDKKETAVGTAIKCNIKDSSTRTMSSAQIIKELKRQREELKTKAQVQNTPLFKKNLIIYRAVPEDKGNISMALKAFDFNVCSIGDGNNDVFMLKNSNIGISVLGKEGAQAILNSDFVLKEFQNIKKLILVFGKNNFINFSKVTLNCFYKNIFFIFIQFIYNFYSRNTVPIYSEIFMNYFNIIYTSVILYSILIGDVNKEQGRNSFLDYGLARNYFKKEYIYFNLFYSILESLFFFMSFLLCFSSYCNIGGFNNSYVIDVNLISLFVFFIIFFKQIGLIYYFDVYNVIAIVFTLFFQIISLFTLQDINFLFLKISPSKYIIFKILTFPYLYFIVILVFTLFYILQNIYNIIENKILGKYK